MKLENLKAIFVVAGHGKKNGKADPGAVFGNSIEREEVVKISKNVLRILKYQSPFYDKLIYGIGVEESMELIDKIKRVNSLCDMHKITSEESILISIHVNSGGGTGVEAWHYGDNELSMNFGDVIAKSLSNETALRYRGSKSEFLNRWGSLGIINRTTPLSALVECGFIDSLKDMQILQNPEDECKFATGIVKGVLKFFKCEEYTQPEKEKPTSRIAKDVPIGSWFEEAVQMVNANKIMSNFPDGNFEPARVVTRAEQAEICKRLMIYFEERFKNASM